MPAILVAASAQVIAAPPAPPAPPMVYTSPPPDRSGGASTRAAERIAIEVEARAGAETLWSGVMNVAANQGASFTRRLAEAGPSECPTPAYEWRQETSLQIELTGGRPSGADTGNGFGVSVR